MHVILFSACKDVMASQGLSIEAALAECVGKTLGSDFSMTKEFEYKFSLFLDDARQMGMPRCWQKATLDLHTYLTKENKTIPAFRNNYPGTHVSFGLCMTARNEFQFFH